MKKQNKAILVEYINDCNEWAWYGVYINTTAKRAIKAVWEEMYDDGRDEDKPVFKTSIDKHTGMTYLENDDLRAMQIDLIDLSN